MKYSPAEGSSFFMTPRAAGILWDGKNNKKVLLNVENNFYPDEQSRFIVLFFKVKIIGVSNKELYILLCLFYSYYSVNEYINVLSVRMGFRVYKNVHKFKGRKKKKFTQPDVQNAHNFV